ncbi:MAG: hypothetical protein Q8P42_06830 [Gallionella sp.]|nr:hypothetical protein [Gallionella sp.]
MTEDRGQRTEALSRLRHASIERLPRSGDKASVLYPLPSVFWQAS